MLNQAPRSGTKFVALGDPKGTKPYSTVPGPSNAATFLTPIFPTSLTGVRVELRTDRTRSGNPLVIRLPG